MTVDTQPGQPGSVTSYLPRYVSWIGANILNPLVSYSPKALGFF
jgi:hypothetical protein